IARPTGCPVVLQRLVDRVVGLPREIKPEPSHGPIRRTIVSHNDRCIGSWKNRRPHFQEFIQRIKQRKGVSGKGNDDAEESRDDDTNAEESDDSVAIETNEQVEDSEPGTTPEIRLKRWFLQYYRDVYFAWLNLNEKEIPNC
ncbi:hypothetical protein HAX54_043026, partial [Datura stramonium]|nr:hypothetical protein [Datura stramonium]